MKEADQGLWLQEELPKEIQKEFKTRVLRCLKEIRDEWILKELREEKLAFKEQSLGKKNYQRAKSNHLRHKSKCPLQMKKLCKQSTGEH